MELYIKIDPMGEKQQVVYFLSHITEKILVFSLVFFIAILIVVIF